METSVSFSLRLQIFKYTKFLLIYCTFILGVFYDGNKTANHEIIYLLPKTIVNNILCLILYKQKSLKAKQ